jgi:hypothetical protein
MELFHQKTVVYVDANGKRAKKGTPGATAKTIVSKEWYATVKNEKGKRENVPLSTDKRTARVMLDKILTKIERKKAGVKSVEE